MSETASLGAFVIALYYALQLTRSYHPLDIVKCAAAVAAGTLIRYENWVFGAALVPILLYVAWRRRGYKQAEAWTFLFSVLAFAGCAGWILVQRGHLPRSAAVVLLRAALAPVLREHPGEPAPR